MNLVKLDLIDYFSYFEISNIFDKISNGDESFYRHLFDYSSVHKLFIDMDTKKVMGFKKYKEEYDVVLEENFASDPSCHIINNNSQLSVYDRICYDKKGKILYAKFNIRRYKNQYKINWDDFEEYGTRAYKINEILKVWKQ